MRVLIVEDEVKLAFLLRDYLAKEGYELACVHDGNDVMSEFESFKPDLVILDLMLPNRDGLSLCNDIRRVSQVPIIITTAKVEEVDRLLGLELGADDYVCKPYSPREVVARVKAVLRRTSGPKALDDGFALDADTHKVHYQGRTLEVTTVEFHLLKKLSDAPGVIYSRDRLMDGMYQDFRVVHDRTIDSHIKQLRKKLSTAFPNTQFIHSVYGAGYRFEISE